MKAAPYEIILDQDESGAWIARAPSIPGFHTYGRSLNEVRGRVREALGLFVDDADRAELDERILLPAQARRAVRRALSARSEADRASAEAQHQLSKSARELILAGYSLRDAAHLLGLSHQRVAQLIA